MDNDVIVALLALIGTLGGSFGGIITANKLTNFRIQQLEKRVNEHNNFASRMPVLENEIKHIKAEVSDIKRILHVDGGHE